MAKMELPSEIFDQLAELDKDLSEGDDYFLYFEHASKNLIVSNGKKISFELLNNLSGDITQKGYDKKRQKLLLDYKNSTIVQGKIWF